MVERAEAQAAMEAVGPLSDDVEAVLAAPDGSWIVRFRDLDIAVEHDGAAGCLSFAAGLGPVPEDRRSDVHAELLRYNLLRRETGGVTAALTADGGAVLVLDLFADRLTAELLRVVVENLAVKARLWRSYMLARNEPSPPDETGGFVTIQA